MPFEDTTTTAFIQTTILKALEQRNNYDQIIHYTRLIYTTTSIEQQKRHKHIKHILDAYDKDPEMQRKTRMLATAHQDPEASYEYLTQRDRDQNLTYDEELEHAIHTNLTTIIKYYGQLIQELNQETQITP